MLLFFDTETTGKLDFKAPHTARHQPDLVQLAACLTDETAERILGQVNFILEPPVEFTSGGQWIPDEVAAIHGITDILALRAGQPRRTVLSAFNHMCKNASVILAHNIDFDTPVMETAYYREKVPHRMSHMERRCTMKMATPIVKLPKPPGWKSRPGDQFKWPTLQEAHQFFLGESFDGAHNAMNDVEAMIRVYRKMIQL